VAKTFFGALFRDRIHHPKVSGSIPDNNL